MLRDGLHGTGLRHSLYSAELLVGEEDTSALGMSSIQCGQGSDCVMLHRRGEAHVQTKVMHWELLGICHDR